MGKKVVIMASDNGIDPICKLSHRGEGIWVQSRSTASSDEGVNALDKVVTDQGSARVPEADACLPTWHQSAYVHTTAAHVSHHCHIELL